MNLMPYHTGRLCEERSDEFISRGSGSASVASKMSSRSVTGVFRVAKHSCDLTNFFFFYQTIVYKSFLFIDSFTFILSFFLPFLSFSSPGSVVGMWSFLFFFLNS